MSPAFQPDPLDMLRGALNEVVFAEMSLRTRRRLPEAVERPRFRSERVEREFQRAWLRYIAQWQDVTTGYENSRQRAYTGFEDLLRKAHEQNESLKESRKEGWASRNLALAQIERLQQENGRLRDELDELKAEVG